MGQNFKETAHLNIDLDKYNEGYERIYGKKKDSAEKEQDEKTRIKELGKQSYHELASGQDTEGFPESSSYIYGFIKGYQASKEGK